MMTFVENKFSTVETVLTFNIKNSVVETLADAYACSIYVLARLKPFLRDPAELILLHSLCKNLWDRARVRFQDD